MTLCPFSYQQGYIRHRHPETNSNDTFMLHATGFTEFPWGCAKDVHSALQCAAVYPMNEAMKRTRGFQQSIHHTLWTCRPTAVKSAPAHWNKQFRSFLNVHHHANGGLMVD